MVGYQFAGAVRIGGAPNHGLGDVPDGGNEGIGVTVESCRPTKTIGL